MPNPVQETRTQGTNAALLLQLVEGLLGEVERLAVKQAATEAELARMGAELDILAAELAQHHRSHEPESPVCLDRTPAEFSINSR